MLVFSKHLGAVASGTGSPDTILVVSLTAHDKDAWTTLHLDLDALDVPERFEVEDLLTGERFTWGSDPTSSSAPPTGPRTSCGSSTPEES